MSENFEFHKPKVDENFYIPEQTQQLLDVVYEISGQHPVNVLLTGPQGCGKTETAIQYAAQHNQEILIMNCGAIREPKEWFGSKEAQGGETYWRKSIFVNAIEKGCVILLDEINRLHTMLHNAIYGILDDTRETVIDEIGKVTVHPNTVFFATANIGFAHGGTFTMDAAFEDRFPYVLDVNFLPSEVEQGIITKKTGLPKSQTKKLVQLANKIREQANSNIISRHASLRQLLNAAKLMEVYSRRGWDIRVPLEYTLVCRFSNEGAEASERSVVRQLMLGVFD